MKKLILTVVFLLCALGSINAQELRVGLKGGLNVASLGGDGFGPESFSSKVAYHAGVFAEIPIIASFSIQPELLYSSQGSKFGGLISIGADEITLDYITVPLMVKYTIILGLSAEIGPVVGILLAADSENSLGQVDVKDNYKTLDTGIAIGASYALDVGIIAGIRYNKGISNINDVGSGSNQNNVLQVWAGYSFL